MKTQYTVALAVAVGFGFGAIAVNGLHAQAKPPAYVIIERLEVINEAAEKEFSPKMKQTALASGGKYLVRGGQVIALDGQPPKRVVVLVYESLEKAQAYFNSADWKELTPLREKAVKNRVFIVEGVTN